jgi:hypothetical protein
MTAEHFDGLLEAFRSRTPFRPFTVELLNSNRFEVDHREALIYRDGFAVFLSPGGKPILFDHESVVHFVDDLNEDAGNKSSSK